MTAYLDRLGRVTDLEVQGRSATYVSANDRVGNESAAIQAVAESAVMNPTWYSSWSGEIQVPSSGVGDGNPFAVTVPGLTAITGYMVQVGPQSLAVFCEWDSAYSWPTSQLTWPSNLLRLRLSYNDYGVVPALTVKLSVLAWGTR